MSKLNKKNALLMLSLVVGILLFAFAFGRVDWNEIRTALVTFPKEALISVFFVNFLAIFLVGSYRWQLILKAQKCPVGFWKVVRAKLAGFTFSYVTPSALVAGEPIRAYMLKDETNCGWERSSASVIIDQMIYLVALFCVSVIGFLFLMEKFSLPADVTYGFVVIFASAVFTLYLFYQKTFRRSEGEHAFFTTIIHKTGLSRVGYIKSKLPAIESTERLIEDFFRENVRTFSAVLFLAFLEVFLNAVAVMITCFYMGHWFGVAKSIGIFSLWALANLVPIPGSLGSSEIALSFVFNLLGAGKDAGIAFSLIFRAINIVFCLSGVVAFLYFAVKTASRSLSLEAPAVLIRMHETIKKALKK